MNNKWKWALLITLAMIVLLVPPFAWSFFLAYGRYTIMGNTYGWYMYMPMIHGSPAMMSLGMIFLMWLTLVASLVLIGLGIAWLVRELTAPKSY